MGQLRDKFLSYTVAKAMELQRRIMRNAPARVASMCGGGNVLLHLESGSAANFTALVREYDGDTIPFKLVKRKATGYNETSIGSYSAARRRSVWKSSLRTAAAVGILAGAIWAGGLSSSGFDIGNAPAPTILNKPKPPAPYPGYSDKAFKKADGCYRIDIINQDPNQISVETPPNCTAPVGNSYVAGSGNFYKPGTSIEIDINFMSLSYLKLKIRGPIGAKLASFSENLDGTTTTYKVKVTQNAIETLNAMNVSMPQAYNSDVSTNALAAVWYPNLSIPKAMPVAPKGLCYHLNLVYNAPKSEITVFPPSTCLRLGSGYYKPGSIVQFFIAPNANGNTPYLSGPYQLQQGLYGLSVDIPFLIPAYETIDGKGYKLSSNEVSEVSSDFYTTINQSGTEYFGKGQIQQATSAIFTIAGDLVKLGLVVIVVGIGISMFFGSGPSISGPGSKKGSGGSSSSGGQREPHISYGDDGGYGQRYPPGSRGMGL